MNVLLRLSYWCTRHAWITVLTVIGLCIVSILAITHHLTINTNTAGLFDQSLPFLVADKQFANQFPDENDTILAVIDGPSAVDAADGAARLAQILRTKPHMFLSVREPLGGHFFLKNGLLYLSPEEFETLSQRLAQAQPILAALRADPSLRGLCHMLGLVIEGTAQEPSNAATAAPLVLQTATALDHVLSDQKSTLDWNRLFSGDDHPARAFVLARVILDQTSLLQGGAAMDAMRAAATAAGLTPDRGFHVRLTGSVALDTEEFSTIETGTTLSGALSVVFIVGIVFAALRYWQLVSITLVTLVLGLVLAGGWASVSVGTLNLISVAFAVMFLGLAVDFGIQFCMRLREQRYQKQDPSLALNTTIAITAMPLLLAGAATSLGFFAFLPTHYKGVADLGLIAGGGIFIAYILTITFMPALAKLFPPGPEKAPAGYQFTKGFNRWLIVHRRRVLWGTALFTALSLIPLCFLRFDFDPLNLKDPHSESVQMLQALREDPLAAPYTLNVLVDDMQHAQALAAQLSRLPTVDKALTLHDLVPKDQDTMRQSLDDLAFTLGSALDPLPADTTQAADLRAAVRSLRAKIERCDKVDDAAFVTACKTLAHALDRVLKLHTDADIKAVSDRMLRGFKGVHASLVSAFAPEIVTQENLPAVLKTSWIAQDGRYRVQVFPRSDVYDITHLKPFVDEVRTLAPAAVGPPVTILESGKIVINAFLLASGLAIIGTALLLKVLLREGGDVVRTLIPLMLACMWTLAVCGATGFPITFANIIGLPLLLGIGVTYPIYHVIAWRAGDAELLSSPMARGVFFSALTTMAAFGTLAVSDHRGTAGMGILLSLALTCALIATYVVLPALLGEPPPTEKRIAESRFSHG